MDHAPPLGIRCHPREPHQEAVFQVAEKMMQRVPCHGQTLRLQRAMELLHAEATARIAEQVTDHPAQAHHVAHRVPLHDIPQDRQVHVVAEKTEAVADDPLTTISTFSLSRSLRTKRSQPATTWISSKHQVTVSRPRSAG